MAKGDGGGGMMGKFGNAAMRGGNAVGALQGQTQQPGLGGFMQANPNFGGGKFQNMQKPGMMGGGFNPNFGGGGMFNPSKGNAPFMPQITPNPAFEQAYGNARDSGMDFPAAMDAAQNQMGNRVIDYGGGRNSGNDSWGGQYGRGGGAEQFGGGRFGNSGIFGGGFAGGFGRGRRGMF